MSNLTDRQIFVWKMLGYKRWVSNKAKVLPPVAKVVKNKNSVAPVRDVIAAVTEAAPIVPAEQRVARKELAIEQNDGKENPVDATIEVVTLETGFLLAANIFTLLYHKEKKTLWCLPPLFYQHDHFQLFMEKRDINLLLDVLKYTKNTETARFFSELEGYEQKEMPRSYSDEQLKNFLSDYDVAHLLLMGGKLLTEKMHLLMPKNNPLILPFPSVIHNVTYLKYDLWAKLEAYYQTIKTC